LKIYFIILTLLLSQAYAQTVPERTGSRVSRKAAQEALDNHNQIRSKLGIPPLVWSPVLSAAAQQWADHLAKKGVMMHSGSDGIGENLFAGYGREYTPNDAVAAWYSEKKQYTYGKFRTSGPDVGHYTQLVWKNTKRVGMGIAKSKDGKIFIVANYYPAGNYIGQRPY
jgi:pathogenesis-related protein 1